MTSITSTITAPTIRRANRTPMRIGTAPSCTRTRMFLTCITSIAIEEFAGLAGDGVPR